jgi:hypothetical protein
MSTTYETMLPALGYPSEAQLRSEFERVQTALEASVSKAGSGNGGNAMTSDLSLDNNNITNAGTISTNDFIINGVSYQAIFTDAVAAAVSAQEAEASAVAAAASAASVGYETGTDLDQVPLNSGIVYPVETIGDLRATEPTLPNQRVSTGGHTVVGIGGREFYWQQSDTTSADNNGTVIVTAGGKRWKSLNPSVVSVDDFGARDATDSIVAIQAAIDSGAKDVSGNKNSQYLISDAVTLLSNVTLKINMKAATTKTGILDTRGMMVSFGVVTNAILDDSILMPSDTAYTLGGSGFAAVVDIPEGASFCKVTDSTISSTGINAANPTFVDGVTCVGNNGEVSGNFITTGGVRYSSGTAAQNKVVRNTITGGQISGNINTLTDKGYGHLVDSNTLISPTRMGIEDQGFPVVSQLLSGTRIINNTILSNGVEAEFFAISAVSINTIITGNSIVNFRSAEQYALEIFSSYGIQFGNNSVVWNDGNPTGCRALQQQISPGNFTPNIILANTIEGSISNSATAAITLRGEGDTVVAKNTFIGCDSLLMCDAGLPRCTFEGNIARVTTAATATRTMITGGASFIGSKNTIIYDAIATGTAFSERVFQAGYTDSLLEGNLVLANDVSNDGTVIAYLANGVAGTNVKLLNNNFLGGARMDLSALIDPVTDNNTVDGGVIQSSRAAKGFYDADPVTKQTVSGSRGSNAALADLITKLELLGLITDGTS